MLDFLRKRKRSWIITFLLGLIIVVFVAFYGGTQFQDSGVVHVAMVNGEIITQREFAQRYQREEARYRELFKGSLTPETLKSMNLEGMIIDDLINKKLALQEARKLGIVVTDEELALAISKTPEFQVGGKFNKAHYLQLLAANRITPGEFEDEQREQLILQRLYEVLTDAVRVGDAELQERFRFEQEKINLHFVRLPLSDFSSSAKPTDEEIKNFYERNQGMLKEPVKVQVEYLAYPFDKFTQPMKITEQEIEEYYKTHKDSRFRKPRQAKVKYVSLRLAPEAPPAEKAALKARAERMVAEARGGKDFNQIIKEASADPANAGGGDAGWVVQGQLPPQLEKAVFSLAKGQVSDAVDAPGGGLQILKVEDIKEEKTESLKEAGPEIARILTAENAKRNAAAAADRDREKVLSGADFATLAAANGAAVNVTRLFANGEVLPEIGDNPEFYKSAFALDAKGASPVVQGGASYYLLRLKQRKEAGVPPLEETRQRIEKTLIENKAQDLLAQKANILLEQLRKEKNLARVAEQNGLKLDETGPFLRSAPQLPKIGDLPELARGVPVSAQSPIGEKVYKQRDAAYLIALKTSEPADMTRFEQEKNALEKQARGEAQQRVAKKFIEGLKAKADIKVQSLGMGES